MLIVQSQSKTLLSLGICSGASLFILSSRIRYRGDVFRDKFLNETFSQSVYGSFSHVCLKKNCARKGLRVNGAVGEREGGQEKVQEVRREGFCE